MLNMFGRDYEEIGSSDKGLILKSSGKIKIQWGRKFIDLLDSEGNINIKLVKKKEEEPKVEEEQTQEEEQTTTSQQQEEQQSQTRGSTDEEDDNNIYVSFTEEQDTSKEQKYTALKNLGLIFKTQKISNNYPKSGLIYIEDEQQLYIVDNGNLIKYNPEQSIPEEYLTEINNRIEVLEQNNNSNVIQQLQQSVQSLTQQINSLQLLVEQKSFTLACDPEDNQNNN